MKAFAYRTLPVRDGLDKSLGHIICMDMMHRLQAKIRERQFPAFGQELEDTGIEMPCGIKRRPTLSNDMPRMEHGSRKTIYTRFPEKKSLDLRLLNTVATKRSAGQIFRGRDYGAVPGKGLFFIFLPPIQQYLLNRAPCLIGMIRLSFTAACKQVALFSVGLKTLPSSEKGTPDAIRFFLLGLFQRNGKRQFLCRR